MSNVSNNHPYIVVDSESYDFSESHKKPIPEGSALFTLTNIENLVKKYLSDPAAQEEIELDPEDLKDCMQQIKVGYDHKFEQLFWGTKATYRVVVLIYRIMNCLFTFIGSRIRFETEQVQIDKTLLRINNLLEAPTALPSEIVTDVQKKITEYLDFASMCQFALVNRDAYKLAASSMLSYALECGFEGEDPIKAKAFMMRLFKQVEIVQDEIDNLNLSVMRSNIEIHCRLITLFNQIPEKILKALKGLTTSEIFELLYLGLFFNIFGASLPDFEAFFCHVSKEGANASIINDEMCNKGSTILKLAIKEKTTGYLNLLLQYGIEPTATHLTSSLKAYRSPEIARILLNHQANINQEKRYLRMGYNSSSFEIRKVFYDYNLNYCFNDDPSHIGGRTVDLLARDCRFYAGRIFDLKYVLESATVKGARLGFNIEDHTATEFIELKPLSSNFTAFQHVFNIRRKKVQSETKDFSDIVFLLLEFGGDVGQALMFASALGHKDIVEKLLQKPKSCTPFQITLALWAACGAYQIQPLPDFSKNLDIINMLLDYGAEPDKVIVGKDKPGMILGGI
jgi:hypothetical protein